MRDQLIGDTDANGVPSTRDVLLYQVTIRNAGSATATMLSYENLVDHNTTLDPTSIQTNRGNYNAQNHVVANNHPTLGLMRVEVDNLAPGEQIDISYRSASDLLLDTVEMGIDPASIAIHPQSGLVYVLLSAVNRLQIFEEVPIASAAARLGIIEWMERFYLPQINDGSSR